MRPETYLKIGMFLATQFPITSNPRIVILDKPVKLYNILHIEKDDRPIRERWTRSLVSVECRMCTIKLSPYRMPSGNRLLCGHDDKMNTFIIYIEGHKPVSPISVPDCLKETLELVETTNESTTS